MKQTLTEFKTEQEIIEELAEIEHIQWMSWAQTLMDNEELSPARVERWKKLMVPYVLLTDEMQEFDREYARIVLDKLKEFS